MSNDKKKEVFDFIVKCSENEKIMCDYFSLIDFLKISLIDGDSTELSRILTELKNENRIKASVGEYLPNIKSEEKENNEKRK